MTTIGFKPSFKAFPVTNLVCGMGPSDASTSKTTPSTIDKIRSTSPPKSACPGVSTILIWVPCQLTDVHFDKMVIPLSRSKSLLSITQVSTFWLSRKVPLCFKSPSTIVVLPWSTWAIMAMFLKFIKLFPLKRLVIFIMCLLS